MRDEVSDASPGLFEDFGGSGLEVRLPVRRIVVLVRDRSSVIGLRLVDSRTFRIAPSEPSPGVREYVSAPYALESFALRRRILREAELHLVSSRRADHCVRDPGIATGGVERIVCPV